MFRCFKEFPSKPPKHEDTVAKKEGFLFACPFRKVLIIVVQLGRVKRLVDNITTFYGSLPGRSP